METNLLHPNIYENLPELLLNLTSPFAGREKDIVLLSSLGVISAALPKVFGIYDSSKYSPNLYIMVVAPAASGKGIMNNSKKLIEPIHHFIKEISLANKKECESEKKKKGKDTDRKCPDLEVKIIPGNASSAAIYTHLNAASYGLLIFETEADTISAMLKQDWGNFSDILRKAFHHETISISRETENKFIEVRRPELSLVISGTPNQIKPLVESQENGLFSRFIYYFFNEVSRWKDVSPKGNPIDKDSIFSTAGKDIFNLYNLLFNNPSPIEVKLTESQWERFNSDMTTITDLYISQNKTEMLSSIKRHGLIMFRICIILTIIRNNDLIEGQTELICEQADYEIAFNIIKCTIDHSIEVSNILAKDKYNLPVREVLLFSSLNHTFRRSEALDYAVESGIPIRTLDSILSKWIKKNVIKKVSNGVFEKIIK